MTLLDWLMFNVEIFTFIRGIRTVVNHIRLGTVDPFGRQCVDMGRVDHPYYQSRKEKYSHEHYIQVDVVLRGAECIEKTTVLLHGPDHRDDAHVQYIFQTSTVQVAPTVENIIKPWMEQGYTPVRREHFFDHR